jgi:exopolysaccharide biosynthesis polyprenyl glycosylphosphotransferase
MLRYNLRYQLFLIISDTLIVVGALALSSYLRLTIDFGADPLTSPAFITPAPLFVIAPLLWVFAFQQAGVYRPQGVRFRPAARRLIAGHFVAGLLFFGALYVTFRDYSRLQAVYLLALTLTGTLLHRAVLRLFAYRLRHMINSPRRIAIIGVGDSAAAIGERIAPFADYGLLLVGYIAPSPAAIRAPALEAQVLGTLDDLRKLVVRYQIDEILIDAPWFEPSTAALASHVTQTLESFPVNIRLAHDYSSLAYFRATSEDFNNITLISLREAILSPAQRVLKRFFDIGFSLLVLLLTAPLFLIIAIAIRLDSPGEIIFRQQRIGQHGKPFIIYKFRTMTTDSPPLGALKHPDDPRVTRVGRFLRRTSLDELPQFINVLRGEMSVVGPRPEQAALAQHYQPWQRKRLEVPQGITGWWQVSGRADRPMQQHTEDDLFYVRNYSIWLDIRIILKTVLTMISGRGAY